MPTVLGLTNDTNSPTTGQAYGSPSPAPNNKGASGGAGGKIGEKGRLDTIFQRNRAAAMQYETLLWQALCDMATNDGESAISALDYMADDCSVMSPVLFGRGVQRAFTKASQPDLEVAMQHRVPWTAYRIQQDSIEFVEVDLMAVLIMYKVTLFRQGNDGTDQVEAVATSTWRQNAGADWLLCGHLAAFVN